MSTQRDLKRRGSGLLPLAITAPAIAIAALAAVALADVGRPQPAGPSIDAVLPDGPIARILELGAPEFPQFGRSPKWENGPYDCEIDTCYFSNANSTANPFVRWDDFICTQTGDITEFSFVAGGWLVGPCDLLSNLARVRVIIAERLPGGACGWFPGVTLCANDVPAASLDIEPLCVDMFGIQQYQISGTLPVPCRQTEGMQYAISIQAIVSDPAGCFMCWGATSQPQLGLGYGMNQATGATCDGPQDTAFTLLTDPDPCADCPCPEDVNRDGTVSFADILRILAAWGDCPDEDSCPDPQVCGEFVPCAEPDCFCFTTFTGDGVCYRDFSCGAQDCPDGNCPPGFVCVVETCCDVNKCAPMINCDEVGAAHNGTGLTASGAFIEARVDLGAVGGVAGELSPPAGIAVPSSSPGPMIGTARSAAAGDNLVLNGSFEDNVGAGCQFNLSNAAFNAVVANANAYGAGNELDVMDDPGNCGFGLAPIEGTTKIGVAAATIDQLAMRLSAPVVAGDAYVVRLVAHAVIEPFSPEVAPIDIGISADPNAFGTLVFTGTPSTTMWSTLTGEFVAPVGGGWLTIRPFGGGTIDGWTHIDSVGLASGNPCQNCPCPEDVNRDGVVSFADILRVLGAWGPCRVCDDCEDGTTDSCDIVDGGFGCIDCITPAGDCVCVQDDLCANLQACPGGNCPPGFFCCTNTCCGVPLCFPVCTDPLYEPEAGEVPNGGVTGSGVYRP